MQSLHSRSKEVSSSFSAGVHVDIYSEIDHDDITSREVECFLMDASWIDYRESLVRHAHIIVDTSQQQSAIHDEQQPTVSMSKDLFFVDMRQNDKT